MMDARILAVVALPALAGLGIALAPRRWAEALSLLGAAGATAAAATLLPAVLAGGAPELRLLEMAPGLPLAFRVDGLALTFGLLAASLWGLAGVYSAGYVRATEMTRAKRFYACYALSIAAATGTAFSGNLFTFLLFYEALTVATYPLVAHAETPEAVRAARRYLGYALSAGLLLTVASAWTWRITGSLDFVPGGFVAGVADAETRGLLFALFIVGCGVKAAIMPLHAWLPAAMVAPAPVSALLHAVAVVKAGVFGCLRVIGFVFGPEGLRDTGAAAVLTAACAFTVAAASVAALGQASLKRRLAYSTVAHLSYIVLGASLLAEAGAKGAVMHLVNHGLAKITLFFGAGAVYAAAHAETIDDLRGLGRSMPWTFGAFTVASFGLIGIPGLCGFVSKFLLGRGAVEAGQAPLLLLLAGGSVLSASYLLPILRRAWFAAPEGEAHGEAPATMVVPMLLTAAAVVVLGAWPPAIALQEALAERAIQGIFAGGGP